MKSRCEEIIKKKKAIILEFSKELNYKDQLYVDSLKKFRTDVELMITFMRKQFHDLRSQMLDHMKKIEDKFNDDRNKLIESYKKNIENLISQLKEEETKSSIQKDRCEHSLFARISLARHDSWYSYFIFV